jgi:hypothetical protein
VRDERIVLQDSRDIFFHDAGDRVAQLLLLAIQDTKTPTAPPQQFLLVHTHLLFPHNEFSSKIRMREMTKILGFIESYRQRELCASVCGRSDVRIPVILTGDMNGSPRGKVYQYITGWRIPVVNYSVYTRPTFTRNSNVGQVKRPQSSS